MYILISVLILIISFPIPVPVVCPIPRQAQEPLDRRDPTAERELQSLEHPQYAQCTLQPRGEVKHQQTGILAISCYALGIVYIYEDLLHGALSPSLPPSLSPSPLPPLSLSLSLFPSPIARGLLCW